MAGWTVEVEQVQRRFAQVYDSIVEPKKRKRGRPPKNRDLSIQQSVLKDNENNDKHKDQGKAEEKEKKVKGKRGRKKKLVVQEGRENPFDVVESKSIRTPVIKIDGPPKMEENRTKTPKNKSEEHTPQRESELPSTSKRSRRRPPTDSDDFEDSPTPVRRSKKLLIQEYETPAASQLSLRDLGYDYDRPLGTEVKPIRLGRIAPIPVEPPIQAIKKEVRMEIYWPILLVKGRPASNRYYAKLKRFARSWRDSGKKLPFLLRTANVEDDQGDEES
jgi:hypothetical protein